MPGTFAQFEVKQADLSSDFGFQLAQRKFNLSQDQLVEKCGVFSRGPRKGKLRGYIVWIKVISGGWIKIGRNMTDGEGNILRYNGFACKEGSCGYIIVAPNETCPYFATGEHGFRNQMGAIILSPLNPNFWRIQKANQEAKAKKEAEQIEKERIEKELADKIAHYSKDLHAYVKFINDKVDEMEAQGKTFSEFLDFLQTQTDMLKTLDPEDKIFTTVRVESRQGFFKLGFK